MKYGSFRIITLGCKVNQYDGQAIRELLGEAGLAEAQAGERADIVVVNTCTVTSRADEKGRKAVRRGIRDNPHALVIVTGCAAVTGPERYRAIPGVGLVLTKEEMTDVQSVLSGRDARRGDVFGLRISSFAGHTRAFLRIQEGCDSCCSYCIVPYARGPARSRPLQSIGEEARRLVDSGHKEVVLTGIHLGAYGRDFQDVSLCDAARKALGAPGLVRLRLSSIEATEVTPGLLELFGEDARLCPHLHLPLQSGDDAVLRAMNRRYTAAGFLSVVEDVRRRVEGVALTTDVMVGFPGETEGQFENTLRVCREAGFSRMHVFRYSRRAGTPAAEMPQVAGDIAVKRERRALDLAGALAREYKESFVGETVAPLVESRRDRKTGLLTGMTERYVSALLEGPDSLMNEIVPMRVVSADADAVRGRALTRYGAGAYYTMSQAGRSRLP